MLRRGRGFIFPTPCAQRQASRTTGVSIFMAPQVFNASCSDAHNVLAQWNISAPWVIFTDKYSSWRLGTSYLITVGEHQELSVCFLMELSKVQYMAANKCRKHPSTPATTCYKTIYVSWHPFHSAPKEAALECQRVQIKSKVGQRSTFWLYKTIVLQQQF